MVGLGWLRDPDRPTLFDVVFWLVLLTTAGAVALSAGELGPVRTVLTGVDLMVVAVLWLALSWNPRRHQRPAAVAFLVATVALGLTGSEGTHAVLVLIAVANLAFAFGMRTAVVILCGVFAVLIATVLVFLGGTIAEAVEQTALIGVFAAFVLGMTSAILDARRAREETHRLLGRVRELAVAEERARMGAEMHDSIGHHLAVIKIGLENAERFRTARPDAAWDEVRQAKKMAVEALADARRWVRALRPLAFDGRVGSAALHRLAASFDGTGVSVDFQVEGPERTLDPDVELVLYRVLQEGLTNVLRHAEARHVRGRLIFDEDRVTLVIADDGRGRGRSARHGFGLASLADRARALDGTLIGRDAPDGGFELRAELPAGVAG